jgi:hypothetical protein
MRKAIAIGGNAMTEDGPAFVTRYKSAAAKRAQAHRWRKRLGLRCLTVRVSDRTLLPSDQHLESSEAAARIAIALEAWIHDNIA